MKAVFWMTGTLLSFSLMAIAVRELNNELSLFQLIFVRSAIGLICMCIIIKITRPAISIRTDRIGLHCQRGAFHFCGQYGWFLGIGLLPLAEVFALEFTIPIWTAIIAALFLGEKINKHKMIAIFLGVAGVLLIVKPGLEIVNVASFFVLGAAVCYSAAYSTTKALASTEKPEVILFYMCLIQFPVSLALSISDWLWPDGAQWLWLWIIAITALTANYCATRAMNYAEVTTVVTLDFLRLPLISVVGILLYNEQFEASVLVGGALMLLANIISVQNQQRGTQQIKGTVE